MSRTLISVGTLACTAVVAFAAPSGAFADIDLSAATHAASVRVGTYAKALKASNERAVWLVSGCHTVDAAEATCRFHVRLTRHGRTTFHHDGRVTVVDRGGRLVARIT